MRLTVNVAVSKFTGEALTFQWMYSGSNDHRLVIWYFAPARSAHPECCSNEISENPSIVNAVQ